MVLVHTIPPLFTESLYFSRWLGIGPSLRTKGEVKGNEALQIDGKVEGPILLTGHELTVGSHSELISEVQAGAVTFYGKIVGNVQAHSGVDIKRDGSITVISPQRELALRMELTLRAALKSILQSQGQRSFSHYSVPNFREIGQGSSYPATFGIYPV